MRFKILSVGREKSDPAAAMVDDYVARIGKFVPVDDIVLKPGSKDRLELRLRKENPSLIVALDERGKQYDSVRFSKLVEAWMNSGHKSVAFAIGGAEGLEREVLEMADSTISLSRMTLPHRLARLILTEQLYRGLCIVRNVPYHK